MSSEAEQRRGVLYAIAAYGTWGALPLYFKLVDDAGSAVVLAHRVFWSFLLLAVIVSVFRKWGKLRAVWQSRQVLATLLVTTLLIAFNWLVFIYSIATDQLLQASLGYFIIPLMNVLLGAAFLQERLRPYQRLSVALAATGVLVLSWLGGAVPWISLLLATAFSFYGLLRKTIAADGLVCLTVETLLLCPIAAGYIAYHAALGPGLPPGVSVGLMSLSGLATAVPLLLFAGAARRLRLSTLGIMQYLAPTLNFVLAVLVFHEPFSRAKLISFSFIWAAVLVYSIDTLRGYRTTREIAVAAGDSC